MMVLAFQKEIKKTLSATKQTVFLPLHALIETLCLAAHGQLSKLPLENNKVISLQEANSAAEFSGDGTRCQGDSCVCHGDV